MKFPALLIIFVAAANALAADIDTIGGTLLHQMDPTLQGAGIPVAQPEAPNGIAGAFEVNPSAVGQPTNLFTWISSGGTTNSYPNSLGTESTHADAVAANFYGLPAGVAQQVSHVDNYDADYFYNNYIANGLPISARVVNQSFIFNATGGGHLPTNQEQTIESDYDDYAVQYGVLFISGIGNGGGVYPAGTSYNGIGVGVYPGSSSYGPTTDGRSKPDLVSPGGGLTGWW